ncbi:MAG: hypothetical protein HQL64_11685 [Magnetococcales bacterium]|nr:hypothetical protein [Magnetococcales bacterium]
MSKERTGQKARESVSPQVPNLSLTHGQAVLVLWRLHVGFEGNQNPPTWFNSYIKYLRREGVPFGASETGVGSGGNVLYNFHQLMELGVALLLRFNAVSNKDIAGLFSVIRSDLWEAFTVASREGEYSIGKGKAVNARIFETPRFTIYKDVDHKRYQGYGDQTFEGIFLDLGLSYINGELFHKTDKKGKIIVMGPWELLEYMSRFSRSGSYVNIINLSHLAGRISYHARCVPEIKRGPK